MLARRAGSHTATIETTVSSTGIAMNTAGSRAWTPKRKLAIRRVNAERGDQAHRDADHGQTHSLEDDHLPDLLRLGAERHANADLRVRCATEYAISP